MESLNSATESVQEVFKNEMSKMPLYFLEYFFKTLLIIITSPFFYIPFSIFIIYKIAKVIYKRHKK